MKKNIQTNCDRREFLKFMGVTSVSLVAPIPFKSSFLAFAVDNFDNTFKPLLPSNADALLLAKGLNYYIVAKWSDKTSDDLEFGFNNDYIGFFKTDKNKALLCVNHETSSHKYVSNLKAGEEKTLDHVLKEMKSVGVSITALEFVKGKWQVVKNSPLNRKVDALTKIPFSNEVEILGSKTAEGTLANCAGGITPWNTYLTCEENYDIFYGDSKYDANGKRELAPSKEYKWDKFRNNPPEHYGWVVEIDPKTGAAKKHVNLGRFAHECATVTKGKSKKIVVYTGDDGVGQHLYKFISTSQDSLDQGTLYVANLEQGRWIPLDITKDEKLKKIFGNQIQLLIRAREAAKVLGATPLDRPEDIEICPKTNSVYIALTYNPATDNKFGSILKIEETDANAESLTFKSSTFLAGGPSSGFSCPDNMAFDKRGNLWFTTDMSSTMMSSDTYAKFKNNGLYYVALEGKDAGRVKQVASAPIGAELTGPCFSDDYKTLFLSVQHPGEGNLDSHWPEGGNSIPKPAVVAIHGPLLAALIK